MEKFLKELIDNAFDKKDINTLRLLRKNFEELDVNNFNGLKVKEIINLEKYIQEKITFLIYNA